MGVPPNHFSLGGEVGRGRGGERGEGIVLIPRAEVRGHTLSFCYAQTVPTYLVYRSLPSET